MNVVSDHKYMSQVRSLLTKLTDQMLKLRSVLILEDPLAKDSSESPLTLCVGSAHLREFPFCRFSQRESVQAKTVLSSVRLHFGGWLVTSFSLSVS